MTEQTLYSMSEWLIFLLLFGLQVLATEVGFRIGHRVRRGMDAPSRSQINTVEGAALGLLALLLAFTFSMAATRFDMRKNLVLEESNAIGTTYLRAQFLPEPYKTDISDLLRRYVDVRLDFYDAGIDQEKLAEVYEKTSQFHNNLWAQTVAAAQKDDHSITTGLFINSLNQVIDLHATRLAAMRNRIPITIGVLLLFVSVMTMGLAGYACGVHGRRHFVPTLVAALLITAVIVLIVDLHRPRQGLITVSQQSMIDLRESLKKPAP